MTVDSMRMLTRGQPINQMSIPVSHHPLAAINLCAALAKSGVPILTSDRAWVGLWSPSEAIQRSCSAVGRAVVQQQVCSMCVSSISVSYACGQAKAHLARGSLHRIRMEEAICRLAPSQAEVMSCDVSGSYS